MEFRRLLLVALVALVALASGCFTDASVDETGEVEEPNRPDLEGLGQKTCVEVAREGLGTAVCPRTLTGISRPQMGIEILDSFFAVYGSPPTVEGEIDRAIAFVTGESTQPPAGVFGSLARGTSPSRATGGAIENVITPGGGFFIALWGKWDNADGDDDVDIRYADPQSYEEAIDNEWVADASLDSLLGYVAPGTHPTVISASRPAEDSPDFVYRFQASVFVSSGDAGQSQIPVTSHILFTDGSLFRHVRVTSVSRPLLAPDPEGRFPFTPRATSLVDIDDYSAVASGPVSNVYGPTSAGSSSPWGARTSEPVPTAAPSTPRPSRARPSRPSRRRCGVPIPRSGSPGADRAAPGGGRSTRRPIDLGSISSR